MQKINLVFVLLIFLINGCATPSTLGSKINFDNSQTYAASLDKVWEAIIEVVSENNLIISTLEKDSGIISLTNVPYEPSWADEGVRGESVGMEHVITERIANFNIFARADDKGLVTVRVNSSMKMLERSGNNSAAYPFSYAWLPSYSNGTLERLILSNISTKL